MWAAQIPALAERYRVLAPDLPGYGDAPLAPGPLSNVAEVVGFLDDQGIAAAAFVGASFGGRVALEVATAHPDRVTALVLLCPGLRGVAPTAASEAFDEEEERTHRDRGRRRRGRSQRRHVARAGRRRRRPARC